MATTTSLLHTALQNLHVAQQVALPSHTPRPPSSVGSSRRRSGDSDEDDDANEFVRVGRGTAPGTPIPGRPGMLLGQRIQSLNSKDPVSGESNAWPTSDDPLSASLAVVLIHCK